MNRATVTLARAAALLLLGASTAGAQAWKKPYRANRATVALFHFERILAKGKIYDSSPLALHGTATKSVKLSPGRFKRCLDFNGVDSAMFLKEKIALSAIVGTSVEFWICPGTSPNETVARTFAKVFEPGEHKFSLHGINYFARWGKGVETGAEWGVFFWKKPRVQVRGREGADMFVMCCDSPFSSARQQLFLSRKTGRLVWRGTGGYGKNGKLQYRSMSSRSIVWKKGVWTHVKIEYAPYPGELRMFISGRLEGKTALQALPPTHTFILGGSLQNGVPFAGKIDELRVTRIVAPEELIFPYGTMESAFYEYQKGIELPRGFAPLKLAPGEDKTKAEAKTVARGKKSLRLRLSKGGRGVTAPVTAFRRNRQYVLSLKVKGASGKVIVKLGHSKEYKLASEAVSATLDGTWKRLSCPLSDRVVFVEFPRPGTYFIDDFLVTEASLGAERPEAIESGRSKNEAPAEASAGDVVVLHWRLDRGPSARSAFAGGPKGKLHGAKWTVKGKSRACLRFNAEGDLVEAAIKDPQLPRRRLELWLNPARPLGKDARVVWNELESPGCSSVLLIEPDGHLRYQRVYTGKPGESARSARKVPPGKWTHVAVVIDASAKKVAFFVDGKPAGVATMTLSETLSRFGLGAGLPAEAIPFPSFSGRLDEMKITRLAASGGR